MTFPTESESPEVAPEIQAAIAAAVEAATKASSDKIAALEAKVSSQQTTIAAYTGVNVPQHSGGIGTDIAESWSLLDQELASKGIHPLQLAEKAVEKVL